MDKAIVVQSTEQKMAKNGNPYLEVVDQDGKKYGIFDQAKWNLFGVNAAVNLIGEYKGQFFNVSGVESMRDALPVVKTAAETLVTPSEPISKPTSGKNRAFALSYAKDWCIAQNQKGKELRVTDVISAAVLFEGYLENGATIKKKEPEDRPF